MDNQTNPVINNQTAQPIPSTTEVNPATANEPQQQLPHTLGRTPLYGSDGLITRDGAIRTIQGGGSVLIAGRLVSKVEDIPTETDVANYHVKLAQNNLGVAEGAGGQAQAQQRLAEAQQRAEQAKSDQLAAAQKQLADAQAQIAAMKGQQNQAASGATQTSDKGGKAK